MTVTNSDAAVELRTQAVQLRQAAGRLDTMADGLGGLIVPPTTRPVGATGSWRQVFADEFAGSALDLTKWRKGDYEKAADYFRDFNTKSTAFYIPDQAIFRDGKAALRAVRTQDQRRDRGRQ